MKEHCTIEKYWYYFYWCYLIDKTFNSKKKGNKNINRENSFLIIIKLNNIQKSENLYIKNFLFFNFSIYIVIYKDSRSYFINYFNSPIKIK